ALCFLWIVGCAGATNLPDAALDAHSSPPDSGTDRDASSTPDAGMDAQPPLDAWSAPTSCAGPDPVLSLGTYPDSFPTWPNNPVYEATVLELRASHVSIVSSTDLERTIVAHVNGLVYSPGEDPVAMMPDAGPPAEENYVGDDLTIELPAIGALAVGDH